MAAELDGPRIEPRSGAARQLVVFLHGYGADGNDLIEIGRAWQQWLPQAAFVSPHAPEACGQAPSGRQCRVAPRYRAGGDRRLFRHAGAAARRRS
jgi:phospholipase/carboxylesterase